MWMVKNDDASVDIFSAFLDWIDRFSGLVDQMAIYLQPGIYW
jgi:hypothetical protein